MIEAPIISRELLASELRNPRLIVAFEQQARAVVETQETVSTTLGATDALQDATFLTLSPNATLTNERIFRAGRGIAFDLTDESLIVKTSEAVPAVEGGYPVNLLAEGPTSLALPLSGVLATTDQPEMLSNKTLELPRLSGVVNYADDAAAAAGGVPVGGVYHTAGALKVRLA